MINVSRQRLHGFIVGFVFCVHPLLAQQGSLVTSEVIVSGEVRQELRITVADLEKRAAQPLPDVVITNHLGEPRGTARQLSGILVKDLLQPMELREENPKLFSEFYLTFIAADGYRVVFSWNEIFNSPTGEHLYLITARDGRSLREMTDRILVLTPTDFRTGRRHIRNLKSIVVARVR